MMKAAVDCQIATLHDDLDGSSDAAKGVAL